MAGAARDGDGGVLVGCLAVCVLGGVSRRFRSTLTFVKVRDCNCLSASITSLKGHSQSIVLY